MRLFRISVFLFFSLLAGPMVSAMTVSEIQDKMAASDASLKSLQFNYVQETKSSLASEIQKVTGTAYLKKPKNLRIQQDKPEKQLVVSSGKTVYVYTPRFEQVLKDSWSRWFSKNTFFPGLIGFKDTLEKLKNDYRWDVIGPSDLNGEKTVGVHLKSAQGNERPELMLWVGAADFIPRKTEIIMGTLKVTTTLVSLQVNPDFDPGLFDFKPPMNAKVIKMP